MRKKNCLISPTQTLMRARQLSSFMLVRLFLDERIFSLNQLIISASAAVLESIGTFKVLVCRHGNLGQTVKVKVETIDGSAVEGEDYQAVNEVLTFEPNETEKEIGITIVDDNQWEPDEEFFLKMSLVPGEEGLKLGRTSIMEITILNDDGKGWQDNDVIV